MDIILYVLAGLSVAFGLVTAVLYTTNKPGRAFVTKLAGSTAFIAAGIVALSMTFYDKTAGAIIVIAMLFSFWGDFFLARKEMPKLGGTDNFLWGVVSFAVSQTLFIIGYLMLSGYDFNYFTLFLLLAAVVPLIVGKLTKMFKFKGNEFVLSLIYGLFLCATLAVNVSYFISDGGDGALVAMIASIMFLVSDFSLGLYFFSSMKHKKLFNYPIMIFYFGAEVMYALSLVM